MAEHTGYHLSMPDPHTHLFRVDVRIPDSRGPVELFMPSWTPGSYLLREFPRNVQEFRARDTSGATLAWEKTDKNTWRIDAPASGVLHVSYAVYANELTVRTSHLDAFHGYVNGASVFMAVRGREDEPSEVHIDAPAGWRATISLAELARGRFHAASYDELVDSPIEIGTHELVEWEVDGIPHRFAIWGRGNYDAERLVANTRRIIAATQELFGPLPYERYTFILHLLPGGRGGLEHRDSCSLQADRWAFQGEAYENFLALVAHEFFHVWNAKRIRPAPLGPIDYTRENYTRNLWVVEGFTTYYTDLILRRAGLISPERYLERLSESVSRLQALPGRRVQTLEEASFDTWIKFYRPDEHTPNAQISYYQKGAFVALLLDLKIRAATGNERSLDDLMRLLWERYGRHDQGFPEESTAGIQRLAEEVCGEGLDGFFDAYVRGTAELPYDEFLAAAGLRLAEADEDAEDREGLAGTEAAPTRTAETVAKTMELGLRLTEENGHTQVTHVLAGSPAYRAGINAGDEIVALDGLRVSSTTLPARLKEYQPGDKISLALFRRDELLTLSVALEEYAPPQLQIVRVENPTEMQEAVYRDWLGVAAGS